LNDILYLVGGWNGVVETSVISRFNLYSANTNEENFLFLPEARRDMAVVGVINKLYVIGGGNSTVEITYSIEVNPYTGLQRVINNPRQHNWYDLGSVWIGEYLYGIGGMDDENISYNLYRTRIFYTVILPVIVE